MGDFLLNRSRSHLQSIIASFIFIGAIAAGMGLAKTSHAVGQTNPAAAPGTVSSGANSQAPISAPAPPIDTQPASPAAAAPPSSSPPLPAPDTALPGADSSFAPQPGSPANPAFGTSGGQLPTPTASPGASVAPSEVETYVPLPKRAPDPRLVLQTSMGEIKIRLNRAVAPVNVKNIVELTRGEREFVDPKTGRRMRRPFYNGLIFHRVLRGVLIQTGCPFGTGRGGPGYTVLDELSRAARFDAPGIVAMASERENPIPGQPLGLRKDTNGSQFFITLAPMPDWNDQFTIIGKVEQGMEVVRQIAQSKTGPSDRPIKRVTINSAEIVEPVSGATE